jgi:hypothetical protein
MKQNSKILTVIDPDFYLIGIASHENDYRLAWAINAALNISLVKGEDVTIFHDKYKHDIRLSLYTQEFREQGYVIKLFTNRGDNFFLLEDYRNIDFFLKIEGEILTQKLQGIVSLLKGIDIVMGVYPVDIKSIKKISRLLF